MRCTGVRLNSKCQFRALRRLSTQASPPNQPGLRRRGSWPLAGGDASGVAGSAPRRGGAGSRRTVRSLCCHALALCDLAGTCPAPTAPTPAPRLLLGSAEIRLRTAPARHLRGFLSVKLIAAFTLDRAGSLACRTDLGHAEAELAWEAEKPDIS